MIVAKFDESTQEDVEKYQKEYASHCKVHEFLMIAQIFCGSIIITFASTLPVAQLQ